MANDIVIDTAGTEPVSIASQPDADVEQKLTAEIAELWAVHTDAQSVVKKNQQELKSIRQSLGERLHTMKQLLAKPGCQGGWSSFLSTHGISRTTADRLVAAHAKLTEPNCTSGSIREITEEEPEQLAKAVWSRVQKKLVTPTAVFSFLSKIIIASGIGHDTYDDGVLVLNPDYVDDSVPAAHEPTAATLASEPTANQIWEVL